MSTFIHQSSFVDDGAVVGDGTKIWHFCHVMSGAVIGERCSLGQNVVVMPGTRIGDNVKIQNNVSIYEGVQLEDDVFCGPSMVFTNVINPRSAVSRKSEYKRTLVRRGATIGANATVVCGVTLGQYAFVVREITGQFAGDQQAMAHLEEQVIVIARHDRLGVFAGIVAQFGQLAHRLLGNQRAERLVCRPALGGRRLHVGEAVAVGGHHGEAFGTHQQERSVQRKARFLH